HGGAIFRVDDLVHIDALGAGHFQRAVELRLRLDTVWKHFRQIEFRLGGVLEDHPDLRQRYDVVDAFDLADVVRQFFEREKIIQAVDTAVEHSNRDDVGVFAELLPETLKCDHVGIARRDRAGEIITHLHFRRMVAHKYRDHTDGNHQVESVLYEPSG